jgi:hypothetical protein
LRPSPLRRRHPTTLDADKTQKRKSQKQIGGVPTSDALVRARKREQARHGEKSPSAAARKPIAANLTPYLATPPGGHRRRAG